MTDNTFVLSLHSYFRRLMSS